MPKDLRVQEAQAYILQPSIHTGYRYSSGGFGTVAAIVIEQLIEIIQASNSIQKRERLDCQSSLIHSTVGLNKSISIARQDLYPNCDMISFPLR